MLDPRLSSSLQEYGTRLGSLTAASGPLRKDALLSPGNSLTLPEALNFTIIQNTSTYNQKGNPRNSLRNWRKIYNNIKKAFPFFFFLFQVLKKIVKNRRIRSNTPNKMLSLFLIRFCFFFCFLKYGRGTVVSGVVLASVSYLSTKTVQMLSPR